MTPSPYIPAVLQYFQKELSLPTTEIPVFAADVWPRFALALLTDPTIGPGTQEDPSCIAVIALYQRWVAGHKPPEQEWDVASTAAYSPFLANAIESATKPAYAVATIDRVAQEVVRKQKEQEGQSWSVTRRSYPKKNHLAVTRRQYQVLCALALPLKPSVEVDL